MRFLKIVKVIPSSENVNPIQIWIPIPKKSIISSRVTSYSEYKILVEELGDSENNIFSVLYYSIQTNSEIRVEVEFEYEENSNDFIPYEDNYLNLGKVPDLYVDFKSNEIVELSKTIYPESKLYSEDKYIDSVREYLSKHLEYQVPASSRVASVVSKTMKSDCAGYNSLFAALLRLKDIPSLLIFGFNTDKNDKYHTTLYRFKDGKWIKDDVREYQAYSNEANPFLPISIGCNLDISTSNTPPFPRPVLHLQHSLVWIEGNPPEKVVQTFKVIK